MNNKIIVTAAVTGGVHTPTMSDYLPITPKQIANDAVRAYEAGAAVAHIHVRDPETGAPSRKVELYREVATSIKARCNMVVCFTTGAGIGATIEERLGVITSLKPELATFNFGSMNFGLFQMADKYKEFKYQWERPYLANTEDYIFPNTFKMLREFAKIFAECGTKPEMEVYDVSMISNVAFMVSQGHFKMPVYLQFVLGILGGIPASPRNLMFMHSSAEESIKDFTWSVAAAGKHQLPLCNLSAILGGNVRVGLEDSLYSGRNVLAKTSAEQVDKIVSIMRALGSEPASADEARKVLSLKGIDKVNW